MLLDRSGPKFIYWIQIQVTAIFGSYQPKQPSKPAQPTATRYARCVNEAPELALPYGLGRRTKKHEEAGESDEHGGRFRVDIDMAVSAN